MKPLVIIGGGMAAGRLLGQLADSGFSDPIVLISEEEQVCYNRVLLPEYLAGHLVATDLDEASALAGMKNLVIYASKTATNIDIEHHQVTLNDGLKIAYRYLVLATGASAQLPEIDDLSIPGVGQLRSINDARKWMALPPSSVAVVGGGLLGLEAADAMHQRGHNVMIVHRNQFLLNRSLDPQAAERLQDVLQKQGIEFRMGCSVEKLERSGGLINVRLARTSTSVSNDIHSSNTDATRSPSTHAENIEDNIHDNSHPLALAPALLEVEHVLFAVGSNPNSELAYDVGATIEHGAVRTDSQFRTDIPNIFALGECASVAGSRSALVGTVTAQAKVLAKVLSGEQINYCAPNETTRLKIGAIDLVLTGSLAPTIDDDIVLKSESSYRRLSFEGEELRGAVLLGDTKGSPIISNAVGQRFSQQQDRLRLACGQ